MTSPITLESLSPRDLERHIAGDPHAVRRLREYLAERGIQAPARATTALFAAVLEGTAATDDRGRENASRRWRDAKAKGWAPAECRLLIAVAYPRQFAEVEYRKTTQNGHLRRAILEHEDGWRLSNAVRVSDYSGSLRHYTGGWQFGDRLYETREAAERNLERNGWKKEETGK